MHEDIGVQEWPYWFRSEVHLIKYSVFNSNQLEIEKEQNLTIFLWVCRLSFQAPLALALLQLECLLMPSNPLWIYFSFKKVSKSFLNSCKCSCTQYTDTMSSEVELCVIQTTTSFSLDLSSGHFDVSTFKIKIL